MASPRRLVALAALTLPLAAMLPALPASAATPSSANEVVYTYDANNDDIYALVRRDLASGAVTSLLPADTTYQYSYDDPELSPDGNTVLVATDYNGAGHAGIADGDGLPLLGLVVVNRDGTGFRRLTTPPSSANAVSSDTFGAWSPNGSMIVFTRITESTDASTGQTTLSSAIFTVPADGSAGPTQVPNTGSAYTADFNPQNGTQLVYAGDADANRGVGTLTVISTNGDPASKRVLTTDVRGALPAWSPDGATVAFSTITDDDTSAADADVAQIASVPAADTATPTATLLTSTRPTSARTVAEYPAWSADSSSILFDLYGYDSSGAPLPGNLWAVDRNGSNVGPLVQTAGDEAQVTVAPSADLAPAASGHGARFLALCNPTLTRRTATIDAGKRDMITVSGLPPGRRVRIEGYSLPSTTYVIPSGGNFAAASSAGIKAWYPNPQTHSRYRVTVEGCPTHGASLAVYVKSAPTIAATRLGTRRYRFSGAILPVAPNAGRNIALFYRKYGSTSTAVTRKANVTIRPDGTYTVDVSFSGTGKFLFSYRIPATTVNAVGISPDKYVSIY